MTYQAIQFRQLPLSDTKLGTSNIEKYSFLLVERPGKYPEPFISDIDEEAKALREWAERIGFPNTYGNKYEKFAITGASHSIFLFPNRRAHDKHVRALGYMIMWFFAVDDIFDAMQVEMSSDDLNIRLLGSAFGAMANILSGNYTDVLKYKGVVPHFEPLCQVLIDTNELMSEGDDNWKEHSIYFVRYLKEYLIGNFWRYGKSKSDKDTCSELTYLYFRGHFSGLFFVYEMLALSNNVFLSQEMRDDIDFVRYLNATCMAGAVGNDVLGVGKEIEDNETESFVIHKVLNHNVSLEQAFRDSVDFVNQEMREAIVLSERLIKNYPEDEALKGYIQATNWGLEGHLRWYGYSKRYGQISTKMLLLSDEEMAELMKMKAEV